MQLAAIVALATFPIVQDGHVFKSDPHHSNVGEEVAALS